MLVCGSFRLDLSRVRVMGVVNLTPDSFSDGGMHASTQAAVDHALRLIDEGAELIDLGAESTRPMAAPVSLAEELDRLLPVLGGLRGAGTPLSVDTYKPEVMVAALAAGASMINDIHGFRLPGAIEAVRDSDCGLCVMHMQGDPLTMQQAPRYADVAGEVAAFLGEQAARLIAAGVTRERIVVDPGFGFGKTLEHNYRLLNELDRIAALGFPLLAGLSRKGMLGAVTGRPAVERVHASVAAALFAVARGATLVRVHDVAATVDALKVWEAAAHPDAIASG